MHVFSAIVLIKLAHTFDRNVHNFDHLYCKRLCIRKVKSMMKENNVKMEIKTRQPKSKIVFSLKPFLWWNIRALILIFEESKFIHIPMNVTFCSSIPYYYCLDIRNLGWEGDLPESLYYEQDSVDLGIGSLKKKLIPIAKILCIAIF